MNDSEDGCSICLGPFKQPKGLPCFHTFCRECLQMYINSNQPAANKPFFFACPLCRAETKPSDSSKPRNEWAKYFPTNNYILNQSPGIQQRHCPTHRNEILDITCKTCRVVICGQCCLSTHEKCDKTLTEINARKIKKNLLACLQNMKVNLEPLEKSLGKLEGNKKLTESQIKQNKQELLDFVSNQEKYWLKEIKTTNLKESSTLQEQKKEIVQFMEMAQENINDLDKLVGEEDTEDGSKSLTTFDYQPKHTLMTLTTDLVQPREAEVNFQINQKFVEIKDKLLEEDMFKKVENPASTEIATATAGAGAGAGAARVASAGAARVASAGAGAAQVAGAVAADAGVASNLAEAAAAEYIKVTNMPQGEPTPRPFQFITAVILDNNKLTGLNDITMSPDQCFLLTEACFKKVWKYSTVGEYLNSFSFDTEPYGMCLLKDNYVAVSVPYNTNIYVLTSTNLTEKDRFSFGKRYYGLASDDNERIFSMYREQNMCVDIISKNNPRSSYEICHIIKLPQIFFFCDDYRLRALPSGHILIINSTNALNVSCLDQSGAVFFRYQGDIYNKLHSISDIAVGRNFIYIADKNTSKIHRIRHQGSFVDIPLTSNDGISQPKKIFNNGDVLAILSKTSQSPQIQLFSNLSSDF